MKYTRFDRWLDRLDDKATAKILWYIAMGALTAFGVLHLLGVLQ